MIPNTQSDDMTKHGIIRNAVVGVERKVVATNIPSLKSNPTGKHTMIIFDTVSDFGVSDLCLFDSSMNGKFPPKQGRGETRLGIQKSISACADTCIFLFQFLLTIHCSVLFIYLIYSFFILKARKMYFFYKFCMYMMYLYSVYVNRYMSICSSLISFWGTV